MKKKNTIKAIVTADIHMSNSLPFSSMVKNGCSDRLLEQMKLWGKIYKVILRKKAQYLFILGDLFDRSKVDAVTLTHTVSAIVNCPVPVFILPGNHDAATMSGGRFTVEAFSEMNNKDIMVLGLDSERRLTFGSNSTPSIWSVSFRTVAETEKAIREIKKNMDRSMNNILLLHGSILGADSYGWKCDDGLDPKIFNEFDQVIAGHFHQTQAFAENGFYVGSPMQLHFGDCASDCGVWYAEFNDKKKNKFEYIKIRSSRFHVFDYDDFKLDLVASEKYKKGDFIRLKLSCTHADFINRKSGVEETCRVLKDKGFRVDYRHKPISQINERISIAKEDGVLELDGSIVKYVKSIETELKTKRLIKMGKEILSGVAGWNS